MSISSTAKLLSTLNPEKVEEPLDGLVGCGGLGTLTVNTHGILGGFGADIELVIIGMGGGGGGGSRRVDEPAFRRIRRCCRPLMS